MGDNGGAITLFDMKQDGIVGKLLGHTSQVTSVSFTLDSNCPRQRLAHGNLTFGATLLSACWSAATFDEADAGEAGGTELRSEALSQAITPDWNVHLFCATVLRG